MNYYKKKTGSRGNRLERRLKERRDKSGFLCVSALCTHVALVIAQGEAILRVFFSQSLQKSDEYPWIAQGHFHHDVQISIFVFAHDAVKANRGFVEKVRTLTIHALTMFVPRNHGPYPPGLLYAKMFNLT